jgi:hypothetical protein
LSPTECRLPPGEEGGLGLGALCSGVEKRVLLGVSTCTQSALEVQVEEVLEESEEREENEEKLASLAALETLETLHTLSVRRWAMPLWGALGCAVM